MRKLLTLFILSLYPLVCMGGAIEGQWTYSVENDEATITASTATGAVTIPSVLGGYTVKRVGYRIFGSNSTSVTSVVISNNVAILLSEAFRNCLNLTSVTIGNSVTTIYNDAFAGCAKLSSVTFVPTSSVASIGSSAFIGCTRLASIYIPNSVMSIGNGAFANCINLTTVFLPARFKTSYTDFGLTQQSQADFGKRLVVSCNASQGSISVNPDTFDFRTVEPVVVSATPRAGYLFSNWSGDSTATTRSITLTMDSDKTVTATFIPDGGDNDGDGLTNYQESITYGTNPNVAETTSPVAGLYLASQMQAMAIGDLVLSKNANGSFTLNYDIEKSEDLQSWTTYAPLSLTLTNLPPDKAFVRIKAKQ
jgi:uncharacterized repeat protein (TIGR02543 family)